MDKKFREIVAAIKAVSAVAGGQASAVGSTWFDRFRFVEFTASVGAAYGSMYALCVQMHAGGEAAHWIAAAAAFIAAVAYVRNPKEADWQPKDAGEGEAPDA